MGPNRSKLTGGGAMTAKQVKPTESTPAETQAEKTESNGEMEQATQSPIVTKKTSSPLTRDEFKAIAEAMLITIANPSTGEERQTIAEPKEFSTGSLGWNLNEKLVLTIGGKAVKVQVGLNITVVGSKDLAGFVAQPK